MNEDVHPETSLAFELAREVDLVLGLERRALRVAHDRIDELGDLLGRDRGMLDAHEVAVHPEQRRLPGAQVKVGGALVGRLA